MVKQTIVIATKNENKVKEIKKILHGTGISIKPLSAFPPIPDIKEDGKTLEENAIKKAETIAQQFNCPVLADDSGLFVPALNNQPGVKSARYAGLACDYLANNKKLLKAMNNFSGKARRAFFATCMALAIPGKKSQTRIGKIWGKITETSTGENGFGYDPIFIPQGHDKTFAQMSAKEKNSISHRALAVMKIAQVIKQQK